MIGDVEIGTDQALRPAVAVALDLGNDADPADVAVGRPDDAVFGRIVRTDTPQHAEQMFDRPLAIVGVDSTDPIPVGLVNGVLGQPMNEQIFGGAAVPDAVAEVDLKAADAGHALDPGELGLALLQRAVSPVALARDLLQMLPQPLGSDRLGKGIGGIGRCHGACNPAPFSHERRPLCQRHLLLLPARQL